MMKKIAFILSTFILLVGIALWGRPALAGSGANLVEAASASRAMVVSIAAEEPTYSYVGSNKCKMCHYKQYKSWHKTKMGQAFNILKPGQSTEKKQSSNLDPNKDYTTDANCVKCHTVGFGHEGGYFIPDTGDKKAAKKAKKLQNVGCESCHGPGSEYIKVFKEIFKSKRKYKVEELYAVGLTKIDTNTCMACHNGEGPTKPAEAFVFEKMKKQGTHEHFPLKQKEE